MCVNHFSKLEYALDDIAEIKKKLEDVQVESPRVYSAIQPLVDHLLNHLKFQAEWINTKQDRPRVEPAPPPPKLQCRCPTCQTPLEVDYGRK